MLTCDNSYLIHNFSNITPNSSRAYAKISNRVSIATRDILLSIT
ncbi:MAG: hypothetical protein PWP48_1745 [Clostridiales bacterium]|jgi:hypothetical protein|nr:hypothetical protein [Clostridiales bacterium]